MWSKQGSSSSTHCHCVRQRVHMELCATRWQPSINTGLVHHPTTCSNPPLLCLSRDLSTDNLRFLSSRQALADLAHFRTVMAESPGLTNRKWVAFGGSYPGSLAAWFRLKYPHLVHTSVATSAPVYATVNFPGTRGHWAWRYNLMLCRKVLALFIKLAMNWQRIPYVKVSALLGISQTACFSRLTEAEPTKEVKQSKITSGRLKSVSLESLACRSAKILIRSQRAYTCTKH